MRFGALWATVPWTDADFDGDALMQRYRRASVMIGVLPIGRQTADGPDLAAFFWSLPVDSHAALRARGFDAWRQEVVGLWPATAPLGRKASRISTAALARYTHATMRVPAGDGIVFVGDSAHSTSPQLGQGANMALLDAKALALALETAPDVASALARYVALRRAHVRLYQALSLLLTPLYQSDSRRLAVRVAGRARRLCGTGAADAASAGKNGGGYAHRRDAKGRAQRASGARWLNLTAAVLRS